MVLVVLVALAGTAAALAQGKAPVPDAAAQDRAQGLLRDVYGSEYDAARTSKQKTELASKLLERAAKSKADPASHFVLLRVAKDVAVLAADAETALEAVDRIVATYDVDAMDMRLDCARRLAEAAKLSSQHGAVAEQAYALVDAALAEDEFKAATQLGEIARESARKARDYALLKQVVARLEEIDKTRSAHAEYQRFMTRLEEAPTDPEANLAVGRYLCLSKGDWERGIPMLALGSDPSLKALAVTELEGATSPAEQVALGDAWWDLAESERGPHKDRFLARARFWYEKALPALPGGLSRVKVEKRIGQPERQAAPRKSAATWLDVLAPVDTARHAVAGKWIRSGPEVAILEPSPLARIQIPHVPKGSYELEVQFTRIEGTNSVVVMLPFGRSYGMLQMSGWNGRYSGLNLLNGAKPNDQRNITSRPGMLPTGQRIKLSIRVLLSADGQVHFASTLNDRPYIEWRGPQEALSEDGFWRMGAQTLGLGTNSCRVVFHSVRVRDISPPE
jgi:hypothetical protein